MNKQELRNEISRREMDMQEYWDALQKRDPLTYSYPFHQARAIDKLKAELKVLEDRKCLYCEENGKDEILSNGLCAYHNLFFGNKTN